MANWFEPSNELIADWYKWLKERPQVVRETARRFPPWALFRMKDTGHRVTVYSVAEHADGKVSLVVDVTGRFNFVVTERRVFGIDPDNLEPCELPKEGEILGSLEVPLEELA